MSTHSVTARYRGERGLSIPSAAAAAVVPILVVVARGTCTVVGIVSDVSIVAFHYYYST